VNTHTLDTCTYANIVMMLNDSRTNDNDLDSVGSIHRDTLTHMAFVLDARSKCWVFSS